MPTVEDNLPRQVTTFGFLNGRLLYFFNYLLIYLCAIFQDMCVYILCKYSEDKVMGT